MIEAEGAEFYYDPVGNSEIAILNETGFASTDVMRALEEQAPEIAALTRWGSGLQARNGGLFNRDRYSSPTGLFNEMKMALDAGLNDDAVSNVLETSEQMAINRVIVETGDEDEDDIWQQIIDDIDIAERMKEVWRELFLVSNCYVSVLFGKKEGGYKVGGKSDAGVRRKKTYRDLVTPLGVSVLDPLKVVPVGNFMFQQEQLAWIASPGEATAFDKTLAGSNSADLAVTQLISGVYDASKEELAKIGDEIGKNFSFSEKLYLLNQRNVFRVTDTRPSYQMFAPVRMRSVFELLDLKQQLKQMDRAYLLGATNFIILVKKGSDQNPAKPGEVEKLAGQIKAASRVPILIGDHRVEVEIITPKTDKTLSAERYNAIDSRITSRLWQIFNTGNYASGTANDDSIKLARVVARSMESRRNRIRKAFMDNVILPIYERNDTLKNEPVLKFYPSRISLDFDPNIAVYIQDLFTQGAISRHTALAEVDISEDDEVLWRKREKKWDDLFEPPAKKLQNDGTGNGTPQPPGMPQPTNPESKTGGRRGGGNSNGGGANKQSGKPGPARGPANDGKL